MGLPEAISDCSSLEDIRDWLRNNRQALRALALANEWWDADVGNLHLRFWQFRFAEWYQPDPLVRSYDWRGEDGVSARLTVHGHYNHPLMAHLGFVTREMASNIDQWSFYKRRLTRQTGITVHLPASIFPKLATLFKLFHG